ncbi:hypothetical protein [Sporosarcina sp. FSL W7-1283]|uniref:hypothetical protein n=1 Tax=Sporosarcina sp. FSL W7-1283 TaxID=2921560 RepID=UPI0030FD0B62
MSKIERKAATTAMMADINNSVEMVDVLESFIVERVQSFNHKTSPEEISALAELVHATAICPRTMQAAEGLVLQRGQ